MPNELSQNTNPHRMENLLIAICKRHGISSDLTIWLVVVALKSELEYAKMAVWIEDSKPTNQDEIIRKAKEISFSVRPKVSESLRGC